MKPEQLIAELEALLPSCADHVVTRFHKWRLLAPLVLDALKAMQDALERLTADLAAERSRCAMLDGLRERDEANPPPQVISLKNEVERLTVERDEALARNVFLCAETGKALELIASRIELLPPISADEQIDIEAVARWVKAIGAEQVARLMRERDEARAELARLTTPRPIAEAPKDGTGVLAWTASVGWAVLRHLDSYGGWVLASHPTGTYNPTHFLPLPVKP